jgi:phosphopantetheine--protein transferase-like protein
MLGLGHDVVDVPAFAKQLNEPGTRMRNLFSMREIWQTAQRSQLKHDDEAVHLAARWAGKEAFLKAAGTGLREPFSLCEIEAVRLPGGAPAYHFSGRSAQWVEAHRLRAHLSLSHEDGMAMAYCILETET